MPGLELADSVTVDPHKWFFQAYDLGALLVRRGTDLHDTFARSPEYYRGGRPVAAPPDAGGHDSTTPTPGSSTSTSSASRAPAGSARSSCGRRGSTSAPQASAG
ncbi:MAG: pyridoxal-dependent decarboxylase [Chloroflexota bacterium]